VALAGESEGVTHLVHVDRLDGVLRVLGDDREKISQQVPLVRKKILVPLGDEGGLRLPFGLTGDQPDANVRRRNLAAPLGDTGAPSTAPTG
jgi:hypothetical protein